MGVRGEIVAYVRSNQGDNRNHDRYRSLREKGSSFFLESSLCRMLKGSYRMPMHHRRPSTNKIPANHNSRTVDSKMLGSGNLCLFISEEWVA